MERQYLSAVVDVVRKQNEHTAKVIDMRQHKLNERARIDREAKKFGLKPSPAATKDPEYAKIDRSMSALERSVDRLSAARQRVREAEERLRATQERNRAAGISAVQTGPKGGRYYVGPSGEKVYVKR